MDKKCGITLMHAQVAFNLALLMVAIILKIAKMRILKIGVDFSFKMSDVFGIFEFSDLKIVFPTAK